MLCSPAQPCLTLLFPVSGLQWLAGPFLPALCPPSHSGPPQSLPICEPPRSFGTPLVPWRAWAKLRARGPGQNSQQ